MSSQFRIDGLDALRRALQNLPADLTAEAGHLVEGAANAAAADIKAAYPSRTGYLRNHVSVTSVVAGRFGAAAIVKNTAKDAWIFENGTQARHTSLGANRGAMPPGHVFVPAMIRRRKLLYGQFKTLLIQHGLEVSGNV